MAMDNTELDVIIPELWSSDMLMGTYVEGDIPNRVQRVDGDVSAYGDILHLPALPNLTVSDVTAGTGAITITDYTPTEAQLTVNKWKHVAFEIVKKANKQAKMDLAKSIKSDTPRALMDQAETDILALYSDVTTYAQGDATVNVSEDLLTAAVGNLLGAKLGFALRDPNRASFVFHTSQWAAAKKIEAYNAAHVTGKSEGGALTMTVPDLYGIPVYFSANVASASSARQNLLFLKEAFALGVQSNIDFSEIPSSALSRIYAADWLYGVKTRAEARAVLIKTKA